MSDNLREQLALLPAYAAGHVELTVAAMAAGIAFSLPLGTAALYWRKLRTLILGAVSLIQTVPSLAILAIMFAVLGGRIGFWPAFAALVLYSMLPMVRNTVAGLEGVDAAVLEAARGMGMTPRQVLFKVRFPLALPVIMAGVRTATVWTVGLATIATLVGATSLGNYIFSGIQTRNFTAVLVGSVASAILAVVLDALLGLAQGSLERRTRSSGESAPVKRNMFRAATAVAVAVIATGFVYAWISRTGADVVVAGKPFTEQHILSRLIADRLESAGYKVDVRQGLGSTVAFDATASGSVDTYLEYSGTIWANYMKEDSNPGRDAIRERTIVWMEKEHGVVTVGPIGFENRYALAMRRDRANALGIESIDDLVSQAENLTIGSDVEFFQRPEWYRLRDTYGLDFRETLSFDSTLMYRAVHERQVDVITAYTTDGRVAAFDLAILEDPRNAFLPYDGLLVVSGAAATDARFLETLKPLAGAISNEAMREANRMVDVERLPIGHAVAYLERSIAAGPD